MLELVSRKLADHLVWFYQFERRLIGGVAVSFVWRGCGNFKIQDFLSFASVQGFHLYRNGDLYVALRTSMSLALLVGETWWPVCSLFW